MVRDAAATEGTFETKESIEESTSTQDAENTSLVEGSQIPSSTDEDTNPRTSNNSVSETKYIVFLLIVGGLILLLGWALWP